MPKEQRSQFTALSSLSPLGLKRKIHFLLLLLTLQRIGVGGILLLSMSFSVRNILILSLIATTLQVLGHTALSKSLSFRILSQLFAHFPAATSVWNNMTQVLMLFTALEPTSTFNALLLLKSV